MNNYQVAFLPASDDGCGFYRMWLTFLRTPNSKWVQANDEGMVSYNQFSQCSIGVVQRLASTKNYETLQAMKQLDMKIIYDLDDDMWAVQASNPAKSLLKMYEDYRRGFVDCSQLCNAVTVSTLSLQSSIKNQIGTKVPVHVIGNAVDLSVIQPSPLPKNKNRVIIGWAGSNTHIVDLAQMGNALDEVIHLPKVCLHWVGMYPPGKSLLHHPRVGIYGWVPPKEYPIRLATWNWDIGVAPLENNRFNRSKSAIKMMEMGALKIPCLCSPVQPYMEFTSLDTELKWLQCSTEKQWSTKLKELVVDEDKRKYYGERMYNVVKEFYNMEKRSKIWHSIFNSVLT